MAKCPKIEDFRDTLLMTLRLPAPQSNRYRERAIFKNIVDVSDVKMIFD